MIKIKKINESIDSNIIFQYLSKNQLLELFKEKLSDEEYISFLKQNIVGNKITNTLETTFLNQNSLKSLIDLIKDYNIDLFNNIIDELSQNIF